MPRMHAEGAALTRDCVAQHPVKLSAAPRGQGDGGVCLYVCELVTVLPVLGDQWGVVYGERAYFVIHLQGAKRVA